MLLKLRRRSELTITHAAGSGLTLKKFIFAIQLKMPKKPLVKINVNKFCSNITIDLCTENKNSSHYKC